MIEKPAQGTAPSNLSIAGRYILQPEIFGVATKEPGQAARYSPQTAWPP